MPRQLVSLHPNLARLRISSATARRRKLAARLTIDILIFANFDSSFASASSLLISALAAFVADLDFRKACTRISSSLPTRTERRTNLVSSLLSCDREVELALRGGELVVPVLAVSSSVHPCRGERTTLRTSASRCWNCRCASCALGWAGDCGSCRLGKRRWTCGGRWKSWSLVEEREAEERREQHELNLEESGPLLCQLATSSWQSRIAGANLERKTGRREYAREEKREEREDKRERERERERERGKQARADSARRLSLATEIRLLVFP